MNIEDHYKKEIELFMKIGTPYPYDTTIVFWVWIAELIVECFNPDSSVLRDCLGDLITMIGDDIHLCGSATDIVKHSNDEYQEYMTKLEVSEKLDKCGSWYIEQLSDSSLIKVFIELLTDYINSMVPYVFECTSEWLKKETIGFLDDEKHRVAKKNCREYIAKYNALIKDIKIRE